MPTYHEVTKDVDEGEGEDEEKEEEFEEIVDLFESSYNFRFEEPYVLPFSFLICLH